MDSASPDLDQLALAMAHWLDAADTRHGDPAASSRALEEARRRLAAHHRSRTPSDAAPSD